MSASLADSAGSPPSDGLAAASLANGHAEQAGSLLAKSGSQPDIRFSRAAHVNTRGRVRSRKGLSTITTSGSNLWSMSDSVQYLTDERGERTAVLLPISQYEKLLEDLEDLAVVAERREEPTIPHEQFVSELKRDGIL